MPRSLVHTQPLADDMVVQEFARSASKEASEFRELLLSSGKVKLADYAKGMRATFPAPNTRLPDVSPTSNATLGALE